MKIFKALRLMNEIEELTKRKQDLESYNHDYLAKNTQLYSEIQTYKQTLVDLQQDIENVSGIIKTEEIKAYSYPDKKTSSADLEMQLSKLNDEITQMVVDNEIIKSNFSYSVNGSSSKGSDFQKFYGESLLLSFNTYFDKKAKSVTVGNFDKTCELIDSNYKKMNKRASIIGDALSPTYLDLKLKSLKLLLDIKLQVAEERSRMVEERKRLREQEKFLQEAEKEKAEIAKQRRMYEQSLTKALNEAERLEFEAKLKEIDKREADIDYRINNFKAGYLYVTSSPAMPNMTKIGVTRRLNPLVRIHELSSASVPFPFICHGLVFSDDAFELETAIHDYFDSQRINKENKHKEFFDVTPQEAIDVLRNKFNCEVHFTEQDANDDIENESEEE